MLRGRVVLVDGTLVLIGNRRTDRGHPHTEVWNRSIFTHRSAVERAIAHRRI